MHATTYLSRAATIDGRANKVAAVTLSFWVLKILATTLGETSGDLLSTSLGLGYLTSLCLALLGLVVLIGLQITSRRFNALIYWGAIVATTITGTEIADTLDRTAGLGYGAGTALLLLILAAILVTWQWLGSGIRVYPIMRKQSEVFYWIAILASNSLGTAIGDGLSDSAALGYLVATGITAIVIILVYTLNRLMWLPAILAFWIAFVATRPFGATFGDLLTKPVSHGGLALGTGTASLVGLGLMSLVLLLSTHRSKQSL